MIDGYPRSANTFAYHAFCWAQEQAGGQTNLDHVGHHVRQPAQILRAVELEVPTVLLVRNPREAVLSSIVWHSDWLTIEAALQRYINFYRGILPVKEQVVVGSFEEVVENYGRVIERVNERCGSDFEIFDHTANNEKIIFDRIERVNSQLHGGSEETISRPSSWKEKMKGRYRPRLVQYERELEDANELFHRVTR
ncbi:hypothetical protein [Salinibacter ruber]|uniref:hypothetical protein n=1 Tax=Salinibacter ruber TaxID=146919 RepID=UPI002168F42C|nr:hypothetical protein [Salinibacter ruber]